MNQVSQTATVMFICLCIVGCARNDVEMVSQGMSLAGTGTPIGAVASIVGLTSKLTRGGGSDPAPVSIKNKQFLLSPGVEADYCNDGKFMDLIMSIQDKYRQGDYGQVTPEEAEKFKTNPVEAIGRYAADPKSMLIVTDAGKEYRIRYENEVLPASTVKR